MAELPNCPICEEPLEPLVVPRGDTPPWVCRECSRSWWGAELTDEARSAWDEETRSYKAPEFEISVLPAVMNEREESMRRGVSVSDTVVEHIPIQVLEKLRDKLSNPSTSRKAVEDLITLKESIDG